MVLAVPTLSQEVPGNFETAALWNANVYNGLTYALNVPVFNGYQATSQSILNTTATAITFDTASVDSYGGHSTVTNSSRYTATVPGYYFLLGSVSWTTNTTGGRVTFLWKNGSLINGGFGGIPAGAFCAPFAGTVVYLNGTTDYVEVAGYQSSGGALSTGVAGGQASSMNVWWVHS